MSSDLRSHEQTPSYILLGTVIKPHGIRGDLKVRPCTKKPEDFCRYRRFYLAAKDDQAMVECTNAQASVHGKVIILRLKDCTDRDQAEQLVGLHIWLAASDLPPTGPDEFYLHSLMGKRARTLAGQTIGTIMGLLNNAQDVLIIRDGDHEYLVPAAGKFIVAIDAIEVVFDLPSGLLEINR